MAALQKVLTDLLRQNILNEIVNGTPAAGLLSGAKVHLFTGTPTLGPAMTPSSFTEATYVGYAAQSITWGTAQRQPGPQFAVRGTVPAQFKPTSGATPNTVTGYYVLDSTGATALYAAFFSPAANMVDAFSYIDISTWITLEDGYGTDEVASS